MSSKCGIDIERLNPRHFRILDLFLDGLSISQVSEELSISNLHVGRILNSPSFQHELALRRARRTQLQDEQSVRTQDETIDRLKRSSLAAAEQIIGTMESEADDKLRVKCAQDILDRTGYSAKTSAGGVSAGVTIIINDQDAKLIADSLNIDNDAIKTDKTVDKRIETPDSDQSDGASQLSESQSAKSSGPVAASNHG